jgi:hypothetical protein
MQPHGQPRRNHHRSVFVKQFTVPQEQFTDHVKNVEARFMSFCVTIVPILAKASQLRKSGWKEKP